MPLRIIGDLGADSYSGSGIPIPDHPGWAATATHVLGGAAVSARDIENAFLGMGLNVQSHYYFMPQGRFVDWVDDIRGGVAAFPPVVIDNYRITKAKVVMDSSTQDKLPSKFSQLPNHPSSTDHFNEQTISTCDLAYIKINPVSLPNVGLPYTVQSYTKKIGKGNFFGGDALHIYGFAGVANVPVVPPVNLQGTDLISVQKLRPLTQGGRVVKTLNNDEVGLPNPLAVGLGNTVINLGGMSGGPVFFHRPGMGGGTVLLGVNKSLYAERLPGGGIPVFEEDQFVCGIDTKDLKDLN